jgi:hypothetical protein
MTTKHRARPRKPEQHAEVAPPRSGLVNLWDWRASNAHLFPTDISLRWHLRQHRDVYVESGALLEIAGRHVCDPAKMEATLRAVGASVATARKGAA